jgi:antitoxin ParD1/3/4
MGGKEIPAMETMNISLPDPMKEFVEELVAKGDYSSASEYVRALIREDRKRREQERLQVMLLEGLDSGPMTEMTAADWESVRGEVRRRAATRRGATDGATIVGDEVQLPRLVHGARDIPTLLADRITDADEMP